MSRGPQRAAWTLGLGLTAAALPLPAGFGIFKTRVELQRTRPPTEVLEAETVAVEVASDDGDADTEALDDARRLLERALGAGELYRVVERPREAQAVLRFSVTRLRTEVRDELRTETRRVKVGTRQVWNDKRQRYETKDVYEDRREPVAWRLAEGALEGELELVTQGPPRRRPLRADYDQEFNKDTASLPLAAQSERDLAGHLVRQAAEQAAALVAFAPEPVEALLATNGPLKPANELAQSGRWPAAREAWERLRLKGDDEAARRHNLGVACEALAYREPPFAPEHRELLEQARTHYEEARRQDPGEKYFAPPLARIDLGLRYADEAGRFRAELDRLRAGLRERERERTAARPSAAPEAAPRPVSDAPAPAEPARARPQPPSAARPAPARVTPRPGARLQQGGGALRNGGFEGPLPPWQTSGEAALVSEAGHGRVLQLGTGAEAWQALDWESDAGSTLRLTQRGLHPGSRLRLRLLYADAEGQAREAVWQLGPLAPAQGWASWSRPLADLRPPAARLRELRLTQELGRARLDDVLVERH